MASLNPGDAKHFKKLDIDTEPLMDRIEKLENHCKLLRTALDDAISFDSSILDSDRCGCNSIDTCTIHEALAEDKKLEESNA